MELLKSEYNSWENQIYIKIWFAIILRYVHNQLYLNYVLLCSKNINEMRDTPLIYLERASSIHMNITRS